MMKPKTVTRLRAKIEAPGYYRDRCLQMGELSGVYAAEALLIRYGVDRSICPGDDARAWHSYNKRSNMYRERAAWYARKAFYDETGD